MKLGVLTIILLFSCNGVKKSLSKNILKEDSAALIKENEDRVLRIDSNTLSFIDTSLNTETIFELDSATDIIFSPTGTIRSIPKVKKVTVREKQNRIIQSSTNLTKTDSSSKDSSSTISVNKEVTSIQKEKESKRFSIVAIIASIIVLIIGFLIYKKYK